MIKQVLICEDSLTVAYCIKNMLTQLGYNTDMATTAKDTLELLKKKQYDLLTLDVLLPDISGLELAKEIQKIESTKNLPIIVISTTDQKENDLNFEHNIVCWLEKSFNINALQAAIKKITNQTEESSNLKS
jgi:CheY-like chemotaxis protein